MTNGTHVNVQNVDLVHLIKAAAILKTIGKSSVSKIVVNFRDQDFIFKCNVG